MEIWRHNNNHWSFDRCCSPIIDHDHEWSKMYVCGVKFYETLVVRRSIVDWYGIVVLVLQWTVLVVATAVLFLSTSTNVRDSTVGQLSHSYHMCGPQIYGTCDDGNISEIEVPSLRIGTLYTKLLKPSSRTPFFGRGTTTVKLVQKSEVRASLLKPWYRSTTTVAFPW
jgi:hypothetical protein